MLALASRWSRRGVSHADSIEKIETKDVPERGKTVFPGDLLSFRIRPSGIRDGHFINAPVASRDLRCAFRLKAETIRFQAKALHYLAPEDFVARFHVCEF
jgi:hypothetical protein